jgi:hypothetical protein
MTRSPEACAAQAVADLAKAANKGQSTVKRYIKTLVHDAGWTNRSAPNVKLIRAALTDVGVYMDEDIADLRLSRNAWVHLGKKPFPAERTGPEFQKEPQFQAHLEDWYQEAFEGIPGLESLQLIKAQRQVEYGSETLKIDLLFDDSGTAVIVELKAGDPPKGSVRQLRDYLRACRAKGMDPLRGVLITGIASTEERQAATLTELTELREDFEVEWYTYQVGVTLERVD